MLKDKMNMYFAIENEVHLIKVHDEHELFLTVHKTSNSTRTPNEQAIIIAKILNENT